MSLRSRYVDMYCVVGGCVHFLDFWHVRLSLCVSERRNGLVYVERQDLRRRHDLYFFFALPAPTRDRINFKLQQSCSIVHPYCMGSRRLAARSATFGFMVSF